MNRSMFTILLYMTLLCLIPAQGISRSVIFKSLQQSNTSSIGNFVWHDKDADGIQDFNEPGLGNMRVLLFDGNDGFVGIEYTDANGLFNFSNLSPGSYRIKFPSVQGLSLTAKDKGSEQNDSDANMNGYTDYFTIGQNQNQLNIDAGYKGSLQVYLGSSIQSCEGKEIELNASVFHGKGPYSYQWNNNLGSGSSKIVTPQITTIYSVTVTDGWGTTASAMIIVRVKKGVGEEQCHTIDDFTSDGPEDLISIEVTPLDPGPKTITEISSLGLLGDSREITFEHISGDQPANLMLDYNTGLFSNSNDVGTVSQSKLCYDNYGQGLNFDLDAFDYLKFSNIEVDQGGINLIVTISDGNHEVSVDRKLPGLGSATIFDNELPLEFIPGINNIDLTNIQEVCFTFYTSASSVDLSLESIAACRTTDCKLEMTPDQEICLGETITIEALAPCADHVIYEWDNNLGKGPSHTVSPTQTTTYNVTVTDQAGCIAMGDVSITVNPTPNVTLGPDREICEGETFNITAAGSGGTPPYSYEWSDDTGDSNEKIGIATASSLISVTITDAKGCQNNDQMTLTVHENPSIRTKSTLADCGIENGTATVTSEDGTPPYLFSWSNGDNGEHIEDLAPGLYGVTVTDENGCFATAEELVMERYCGMIGDYVWLDDNGNGMQDDSESGVNGVEVILFNEVLTPLDTTITQVDGYYAFNNLEPNNYHVQFILPQDYHFTSPNQGIDTLDSDADALTGVSPVIQIDSMEQDITIDAGIYQKASIGNFVWLDKNGNGLQENDEVGVANVMVNLLDCNGNQYTQAVTDSDGYYEFTELKPANYLIQYELPENMAFTSQNMGNDPEFDSDANPQNGNTSCELLSSDEENLSLDAGLYVPASIGDLVWHDLNANGVQEAGEVGLANVEMYLLDCNQNYLDTTWTDNLGYYSFEGLIPADYRIGMLIPTGFELSPLNSGTSDNDSDIDPANNLSTCFTVFSGEDITDKDAGLFSRASIGDFVWEDMNGNGIQENGEPGLGQIEVTLYDCDNNPISSSTTDSDGYYAFNALVPGAYAVYFDLPAAYAFTSLKVGNDAELDSDPNPITGYSSCEILISGENNTSYDAGLFQPGIIGDLVWDDLDVDGIQDPDEPGVENIKVILEDCNANRLDSTLTNAEGEFLFSSVIPGIYQLNFGQNADVFFTLKSAGNDVEKDSDVDPYSGKTECFLLESNVTDLSWDAGLAFTGDVGDWVWEDMNGNGIQDSGEPGIAGVGVNLYKLENNMSILVGETYTDVAGYYIFEDVVPGNYFIEFMVSDPYEVTFEDAEQDFIDSDITHANGVNTTDAFVVTPGSFKMDVDAGLYICAKLGDLVWCDYTKNNHWDPDENGINGLDVKLYRQSSNNNWVLWETTTTGWHAGSTCGDGYWSFCVIPGTYYFEINVPEQANLIPVEPNQGSNEEYDSDITHANGENTSDAFNVLSQDVRTDMAGGYFYGAILGDTLWLDENVNGIQEDGENGIQDVLVELFDETGKIAETYSDYDGSYIFRHLLEGEFYLKFNAPSGMEFSPAFSGNDSEKDSDVTGNNGLGTTNWIYLELEEKNFTIDAGLYQIQEGQVPEEEGMGYLYPNPSNGLMTLCFTPQLDEEVSIYINNSKGDFVVEYNEIFVEANRRSEFPIDLSQLPPGQYSISVLGQSKIWEGKFTKVR